MSDRRPGCDIGQACAPWPAELKLEVFPAEAFDLDALVTLSRQRPADTIEVGMPDDDGYFSPSSDPELLRNVDSILEAASGQQTWVVLKDIQQDPRYGAHIAAILNQIRPLAGARSHPFRNERCHAFISSHGARTPLHADDCNGVLLQLAGRKEVTLYDMGSSYFSPRLARLRAGSDRVFPLPLGLEGAPPTPRRFVISTGRAITIPWNWPHEARVVGFDLSISLNVSFETPETDELARTSVTNEMLLHLGGRPRAIGRDVRGDWCKARVGGVLDRAGALAAVERTMTRTISR